MLTNYSNKTFLILFFMFFFLRTVSAGSQSITDALPGDELPDETLNTGAKYIRDATHLNNLQKNILLFDDQKTSLAPFPAFFRVPPIAAQHYFSHQLSYKIKQIQPVYSVISRSLDNAIGSENLSIVNQSLQQFNPEVVVISTGYNDGLRIFPIDQIESNLSAMILWAKKHNAKVILMGSELPLYYDFMYSRQFSSMFQKLAHEHNICYIARPTHTYPFIFAPFMLPDLADRVTTGVSSLLRGSSDCVHPPRVSDQSDNSA